MPLSITTVPVVEGRQRPYEDEVRNDGLLEYRYRGTDQRHRDNAGLRRAFERQVPLVYFHGITPGWYAAVFPVYVVGTIPTVSHSPSRRTSRRWWCQPARPTLRVVGTSPA